MKIRTALAIGCLAMFGFVQVADARPHRVRHHAAKKAVKSTTNQGGTSVSGSDVNGDGTSDVVVTSKPKRKPK